MVITKMNSVFVKHGRWFFGGFTVIIIISFVWFFTPGLDGSIFFPNPNSPSAVVGKVFGNKVKRSDLMECTASLSLAMAASYNRSPNDSTLRDKAWERAFETYASLAAAKRLGITVSDAEVADFIKAMPAFRDEKGLFDLKRFELYKKKVLEPSGYSAQDLDEAIRDLLVLMKIERLAASEAIVTPDEVKQYQLSSSERFDARVARFHSKDLEPEVKVTEDSLKSFYSANRQYFIVAPKFSAETIRFNYGSFEKEAAAQVTDALVKEYYTKHPEEFKKEKGEGVQPLNEVAAKIKKGMIEALSRSLALKAARKFREELYDATTEAADGAAHIEAFRKLAKARGFDTYDTGWFDATVENLKNVGKEPALVEALNTTSKRYPITKVIPGMKAAFVAILTDKKEAAPAEYNDIKAKVEERYRQLKAISLARERANDAALKISEAKNVQAAVDSFVSGKVKFEKVDSFSQTTPPEKCADAADIMELSFSLQPGKVSKTRETNDGALIVFLDKRSSASDADIEKGRPQAELMCKQRKQYALVDSFNAWIQANSENYVQKQEGEAAK